RGSTKQSCSKLLIQRSTPGTSILKKIVTALSPNTFSYSKRHVRSVSWILLAFLVAVTEYAFKHEHLPQVPWNPVGADRFLAYLAVFAGLCGVIVWTAPRRLGA